MTCFKTPSTSMKRIWAQVRRTARLLDDVPPIHQAKDTARDAIISIKRLQSLALWLDCCGLSTKTTTLHHEQQRWRKRTTRRGGGGSDGSFQQVKQQRCIASFAWSNAFLTHHTALQYNTLLFSDVCTKYQEASKIVNLCLSGLVEQCVAGAKIVDLCQVR